MMIPRPAFALRVRRSTAVLSAAFVSVLAAYPAGAPGPQTRAAADDHRGGHDTGTGVVEATPQDDVARPARFVSCG